MNRGDTVQKDKDIHKQSTIAHPGCDMIVHKKINKHRSRKQRGLPVSCVLKHFNTNHQRKKNVLANFNKLVLYRNNS